MNKQKGKLAVCIGCGCSDNYACVNNEGVPCHWLKVDYKLGLGVCSECANKLDEWEKMTTKKVYIAGPMTDLPESNYPAFHAAAAHLREQGYLVFNPAEGQTQDSYDAYMTQAICMLVQCSEIFLLPGWELSNGANIERDIARAMGMKIHYPTAWAGAVTFIPELKINLLSLDTTERLLATLKERADYNGGHIEVFIEESYIHRNALRNLDRLLAKMEEAPVPEPSDSLETAWETAYTAGYRGAIKTIRGHQANNFKL